VAPLTLDVVASRALQRGRRCLGEQQRKRVIDRAGRGRLCEAHHETADHLATVREWDDCMSVHRALGGARRHCRKARPKLIGGGKPQRFSGPHGMGDRDLARERNGPEALFDTTVESTRTDHLQVHAVR
jgi:hypothetical protein